MENTIVPGLVVVKVCKKSPVPSKEYVFEYRWYGVTVSGVVSTAAGVAGKAFTAGTGVLTGIVATGAVDGVVTGAEEGPEHPAMLIALMSRNMIKTAYLHSIIPPSVSEAITIAMPKETRGFPVFRYQAGCTHDGPALADGSCVFQVI